MKKIKSIIIIVLISSLFILSFNNVNAFYNEYKNVWFNWTSNVDGISDIGSETSPENMQKYNPSVSSWCELIEENQTNTPFKEDLYVNGFSSDYLDFIEVGSSPYLDAQDYTSNYFYTATTGTKKEGWFSFSDTVENGYFDVSLFVYVRNQGTGHNLHYYVDINNDDSPDYNGQFSYSTWGWQSFFIDTLNEDEINKFKIYIQSDATTNGFYGVDCSYINISRSMGVDYEMNFEYQWTNATYNKQVENVSIYLLGHFNGTEDLNIKFWNNSAWELLGTIDGTASSNTWHNFSCCWLVDSTYTICFDDSDKSYDSVADEWTFKCLFLFTYDTTINPDPPIITVSQIIGSDECLNISWTIGTYGDVTRIQYSTVSCPDNITNGTNLYNGSNSYYVLCNLSSNITYYFSGWCYNATFGFWSLTYNCENGSPYSRPELSSKFIGGNYSGNESCLIWTYSQNASNYVIKFRTDTFPTSVTDGNLVVNTTELYFDHEGLTPSTYQYYRLWTYNISCNLYSSYNLSLKLSTYPCGSENNYTIKLIENIENVTGTHEYIDNGTGYIVYANYTGNCTGGNCSAYWFNFTDNNVSVIIHVFPQNETVNGSANPLEDLWLYLGSTISFDAFTLLLIYLFAIMYFVYNNKTNELFLKTYAHYIFISFTIILLFGIEIGEFVTDLGLTSIQQAMLTPFILVFISLLWLIRVNQRKS